MLEWPIGWDPTWQEVGSTSNTTFYVDHERIMLVLPHLRSHDTGATARINLEFLHGWFASNDDPPLLMIFLDRVVSQDRGARKLYSDDTYDPWALGFALVGGTLLSRAMGSFFMGLSRTAVPLEFFATIPDARPWLHGLKQHAKP